MALLTCPDCSGKVSDQAAACPHCGRPVPSADDRRAELLEKKAEFDSPAANTPTSSQTHVHSASPEIYEQPAGSKASRVRYVGASVIALTLLGLWLFRNAPPAEMPSAAFNTSFAAIAEDPDGTVAERAAAKTAVMATLREPSSAEFESVTRSRTDASVMCGMVNARNGFGGMTGMVRFWVRNGEAHVQPASDIGPYMGTWAPICSANAVEMQATAAQKDQVVSDHLMSLVEELRRDLLGGAPIADDMRTCLHQGIRYYQWNGEYPMNKQRLATDSLVLNRCRRSSAAFASDTYRTDR